jgi:hypothetical protein
VDANSKALFDALSHETTDLHLRWIIYRQLYGSSEESVDLLNKSGSNVFYLLQLLTLDDVALRLSKLTDPAAQGKFSNLSVPALIEALKANDPNVPEKAFSDAMTAFAETCDKFRLLRNKRIAHADLHHSLKITDSPLPGISRDDVERALSALRNVLNTIQSHYLGGITLYEETIVAYDSDGNKLLKLLRCAHAAPVA